MINRKPQVTDFNVTVPDVGTFIFGRRTMGDELAIQREYARIVDGVTPTDWLATMAGWLSVLRVMTVRGPDGWDLDTMDPLDEETYAKLNAVYSALREQERSFRRGPGSAVEAVGA